VAAAGINGAVVSQAVILCGAFAVAAFAGLAAYLRTAKAPSWMGVASAISNGGCIGIAVCGFCYWKWESPSVPIVLGACSLIGLGGIEMVNYIMSLVKDRLEKNDPGHEEKKS
jgi:phosphatidylglycerophosphate synthase